MKGLWLQIGVVIVIIAAGAVLFVLPGKSQAPTTVVTDYGIISTTTKNIIVTFGNGVSSPWMLSGKARGTWYFEASFPVELRDAGGRIIAQTSAQAQGDWMTSEFVPFSATLEFAKQPTGSHGTLVLKKDNPSGDPAHDDSITIPIVFK